MPVHFSAEVDNVDGVPVIAVHGDADLATVPGFAAHLWRAVDAGEQRILIDLEDTRFIDSKMVEVLLAAANRMKRRDAKLAISCDTENISRVLELAGVARALPVYRTRAEALDALAF